MQVAACSSKQFLQNESWYSYAEGIIMIKDLHKDKLLCYMLDVRNVTRVQFLRGEKMWDRPTVSWALLNLFLHKKVYIPNYYDQTDS
jgi:hypothetical protein